MLDKIMISTSETNIVTIVMIECKIYSLYIYISNGMFFSTLPQIVLNTHMRAWLLVLLKKSRLKSFMRI